ncbi:MAG: OpgC domain-containing protein [Rhodobacteraceae bacterium]|nr:OpgC domain-containing protein [Paracoccaceae bacterium]
MTMASVTTLRPDRGRAPFASADAAVAASAAGPGALARDPRLDFFRGLALFLILVVHTPGNALAAWMPAQWGFSDATEVFVFCSGMASALAYGRTFDRAGWALGTLRTGHRIWQIYWAHLGLFFATAAMLAAIDHFGGHDRAYIGSLNLWKFFAEPGPQLIGLFTLTYVPNYFDILPMYLVLLAMIPAAVALGRVSPWLAGAAAVAVWLMAQGAFWTWLEAGQLAWSLPAEPWSDREWYFNPFGWQLLFLTGFAFARGWIPAPPVAPALVAAAAGMVLGSVLLSGIGVRDLGLDWAAVWREANRAWFDKTDLGILRYVHFLALAYLAWAIAGPQGRRLTPAGPGPAAEAARLGVRAVTLVGRQSLAVFVFSMAFARLLGFGFDVLGVSPLTLVACNVLSVAALVAVAWVVARIKAQPWRGKVETA